MKIIDYINIEKKEALFKVKITPKQAKNEFFSVLDDGTLKIRIKAVPERWKANKELISFLSKELWVKKDNIAIAMWTADQTKIIKVKF